MPVTDEGSEDGSYWSSTMYTLQDAFRYNSAYYLEFSKMVEYLTAITITDTLVVTSVL